MVLESARICVHLHALLVTTGVENSVVHDLDRDQLELRDLVRNSAINRTIQGSSVA
jgi:hypothetical protein